jgi:cyclin-dependent kinase-like
MNKYEKLGVIGEGTFGIVLKCRHKDSDEIVAIKKFKDNSEEDEMTKKNTRREVKFLRALKHENIVELKEAFRRKGVLYLVFEHVDKSVMDLLEANLQGVSSETVRSLTFQLLKALEHCHRHNVIHRDIKPENLLISSSAESLRLCDFGCARQLKSDVEFTEYVATRWYRPPELLLSATDYGKSVDIWAVGCIMGELTDGVALFPGKSHVDMIFLIQKMMGPLTAKQMKRRMELSDFKGIQFPEVSQPVTLQKRYAGKMPDELLKLLCNLVVLDEDQRLSAKAALRSLCFKDLRSLQRGEDKLSSHRKQKYDEMESADHDAVSGTVTPEARMPPVPKLTAALDAKNVPLRLNGISSENDDPITVRSKFFGQRTSQESFRKERKLQTPPEGEPMECADDWGEHYDFKPTQPAVDVYRLPWEKDKLDDPGFSGFTRAATPLFGSGSQIGFGNGSQVGFFADPRGAGTSNTAKNGTLTTVARWQTLGTTKSRWSGA